MPSPNPTVRRQHSGNAVPTTLTAPIVNGTDTSFTIAAATGWPDGSVGNFEVTINAGLGDVEKILCSTRVGTTVNVATRGHDSTTAAGHASGATVTHTISALEIDEANQHTNATGAVHGVTGSVVGTSDSQTLTGKTMSGASNTFSAIPQAASHTSPDTDTATTALHHTLGAGANQAAAGTHTHSNTTGAALQTQVFTSGSGNWTVPTGVTKALVTLVGGGGGGGGGIAGSSGGGGGGQVIQQLVTGLTPTGTVAYSVGGGGAAGVAGSSSTFGSLTAVGGGASSGSTVGNYAADGTGGGWPGCGGAGQLGDGSRGHVGVLGYSGGGGGGGGTSGVTNHPGGAATDGGGAGGTGNASGTGAAGTAGTANTGGGGGGGGGSSTGTAAGGAGGSGTVIIEWVA